MTIAEFVQSLTRAQAASFDGSQLSVGFGGVGKAIAEAFGTVLDPEAPVLYGVQLTDSLRRRPNSDAWEGKLVWMLVLPSDIIEVVTDTEEIRSKTTLRVRLAMRPLQDLRGAELTWMFSSPREAVCRLRFVDDPVNIASTDITSAVLDEGAAEVLSRFVVAALQARADAAGAR
jgi:hypothetical protein